MRAGVRRVGLAGAGQEEAAPLMGVAGDLAGRENLRRGGRHNGDKGVPGSKGKKDDV
jgi:hypothetical protein